MKQRVSALAKKGLRLLQRIHNQFLFQPSICRDMNFQDHSPARIYPFSHKNWFFENPRLILQPSQAIHAPFKRVKHPFPLDNTGLPSKPYTLPAPNGDIPQCIITNHFGQPLLQPPRRLLSTILHEQRQRKLIGGDRFPEFFQYLHISRVSAKGCLPIQIVLPHGVLPRLYIHILHIL